MISPIRFYPKRFITFILYVSSLLLVGSVTAFVFHDRESLIPWNLFYVSMVVIGCFDGFFIVLFLTNPLVISDSGIIGAFVQDIDAREPRKKVELLFRDIMGVTEKRHTVYAIQTHQYVFRLTTGRELSLIVTPFSDDQKHVILDLIMEKISQGRATR